MNRTMVAGLSAFWLAWGLGALAAPESAPAATMQTEAADVEAVLQASAAAWSRGDLDAFMTSYEQSADVTYVGRAGLVRGYGAIHKLYAGRFSTRGRMGRLTMQVLDEQSLGRDHALVTGRFALARSKPDGGDASGIFTLVFHRTAAGWRIMSDHTS